MRLCRFDSSIFRNQHQAQIRLDQESACHSERSSDRKVMVAMGASWNSYAVAHDTGRIYFGRQEEYSDPVASSTRT